MTIKEIQQGLKEKQFSAKELVEKFLAVIREKEKELNALVTVTEERALRQAELIDRAILRGEELSPMAGVPYTLKDAILVRGERCTASSRMLEPYVASYDATVAKRLDEAGAVLLGKTNLDEFGMGASTENSAFGPVKNPHDPAKVAGGSSGGSAASVAAGECVVSLGEDTGGSIRLPASFCGVVGLKPTYGAVPRHGVIALASSLDQVGPFAKTVEDAETAFRAISGRDEHDATSAQYAYQPFQHDPKRLRIGVPKEYFSEGLETAVEKVIRASIQTFESEGADVVEISLPHAPYALAVYYIINTSEASANLARYDGMRYGARYSQEHLNNLVEVYGNNRGRGLGAEVKRRIMLGTFALSAGYHEAYYGKAQKIRTLLRQDFDKAFEQVDVIMGPVSPFLPFSIGERMQDPLAMYLVDMYAVPVNLAGLPAISVPAGKAGNLPVGLHMIANAFREDLLFSVGKSFELLRQQVYNI